MRTDSIAPSRPLASVIRLKPLTGKALTETTRVTYAGRPSTGAFLTLIVTGTPEVPSGASKVAAGHDLPNSFMIGGSEWLRPSMVTTRPRGDA